MNKILGPLSGVIGFALIAFGVYALVATTAITDITALQPRGVAGLNEARAIYAGSFWAMGGLILYGLGTPRFRQPFLLAVGVIFAGFVAARIISIAMDGFAPMLAASIGSEVVAALALIAASRAAPTSSV
ncbi:DUF4345 family protein [Sphingobium cupriresistens]|uniref:DUF4345 family protein n=1 Tax=Sphingobium cupriresistens TaxID=1132417 RepID=UPI000AC58B0C|nr:DUF4345 family protein [Sphingobium cupriresistens]